VSSVKIHEKCVHRKSKVFWRWDYPTRVRRPLSIKQLLVFTMGNSFFNSLINLFIIVFYHCFSSVKKLFRKKKLNFYEDVLLFYCSLLMKKDRTKSDTGRLVEYTKVNRRIMLKELGKMTL
jgi:hypothetical protein